jgi:hypothetical protein
VGNFYSETLTINVTTVNQPPTDINLSPSSIGQNATAGTVVGTLTASDPDAGETFTFSGSNTQFNVSGNQVVVAGALSVGTQTLDVTVTDSAGNPYNETLSIDVTVVNQPPTDINLSPNAIAQNAAPGAVVGTLTASDPDGGETFTFSGSNAQFSVSGNQVVVAGGLAAGTQTLDVTVTDSAGNPYSETLSIDVTVVNQPPSDIVLSPDSVAQNASAGTVVGTLTAVDPDTGDTFTFSGGDTQFNVSGNQVVVAGALTAGAQSFNVAVTDSAGNPYSETLTINVTTVNQPPTDINLSPDTIAQNATAGTVVGILSASDPDAGETFTFSGGDAQFSVSGNQVVVAGALASGAQSFNVSVTDGAGNPYSETLTINVTAVTQPPVNVTFVFVSQGDVYTAVYDGTNYINVTPITAVGGISNVVWSPTTGNIAFVAGNQVYVMNPSNPNSQVPVIDPNTGSPIVASDVVWADDGSLIYVTTNGGTGLRQIMRVDGVDVGTGTASSTTPLTDGSTDDYDPSPAPVGDGRIAFVSGRDGRPQIYVMNADGSGQQALTPDGSYDQYDPAWSPNGQYIAFVWAWDGSDHDIIRVNASNPSDQQNLTGSSTDTENNPGWSPDSSQIIYQSGGTTYLMNADGTGATPISTSAAQTLNPRWRPN